MYLPLDYPMLWIEYNLFNDLPLCQSSHLLSYAVPSTDCLLLPIIAHDPEHTVLSLIIKAKLRLCLTRIDHHLLHYVIALLYLAD